MLSFGIDASRAFSIAFCSARLLAGSGPPSRAATMIARASFENSLPRFASAAPFRCLIEDHLLCPDTCLLSDELQEPLVHARVVRQLGVERGDKDPPVAKEDRLTLVLGEHLDAVPHLAHTRRANEDAAHGFLLAVEVEIGLEAGHLTSVCVPRDRDVDEAEVLAVEDDHAGARPEDGPREP